MQLPTTTHAPTTRESILVHNPHYRPAYRSARVLAYLNLRQARAAHANGHLIAAAWHLETARELRNDSNLYRTAPAPAPAAKTLGLRYTR